ncbi:MAG: hypothetical protein U9O94_10565 [Nanoarchaeota archaeon]|nr:hypothetical protein [Nanoarchaeota archaeon]
MNNKLLILFILFLLVLPATLAQVKIQLGTHYANIEYLSEIEFTPYVGDYELCSGDNIIIPILIKNKNAFSDVFEFSIDKEYASTSVRSTQLSAGKTAILPLELNLPVDLEENATLMLDVITRTEGLKRSVVINANIQECYSLNLEFNKEQDSLCGCDESTYNLILENTGKFRDVFTLSFDAPEWVSLPSINETVITLVDGQRKEIELNVNLPCEIKGFFDISVKATPENGHKEAQSTLELEVSPKKECYNTLISANNVRIDYLGKSIPVTIQNKGTKDVAYSLRVDGIDWYVLSEKEITLTKDQKKTVNLAIHPDETVVGGKYNVDIVAISTGEEYKESITVNLKSKSVILEKIKFYLNYFKYYIGLIIILFIVFLLLLSKRREIKAKLKNNKIEKKEEKKEEKEVTKKEKTIEKKPTKFLEYTYLTLVILLVLAIVSYAFYKFSDKLLPLEKVTLLKDLLRSNATYFIIGFFVLLALAIIIVIIIAIIRKRPVRRKKVEKKLKAEKKAKKKLMKKSTKGIIRNTIMVIIGLIVLSGIIYSLFYYGFIDQIKNFFIIYYPYILVGVAILVILVLILHFYNKGS